MTTIAYAARPLWNEGMLVCPQHMQQQDLYHEQNLDARLRSLTPEPWGVVTLAFDLPGLSTGTLRITKFRGVLPDGSVLDFDASSSQRPASRPIAAHFPSGAESVAVYLGLPLMREGVANCAMTEDGRGAQRYRKVERKVYDLSLARNERDLLASDPVPVVLFEGESLKDFAALGIGVLVRDGGGSYRLSEDYVAPCLGVGAAPSLRDDLQELVGRAVAKRRKIAEERRSRDRAKIDITARELDKSIFLQALDSNLGWLKHCADEPRTSPLAVYQALVRFTGAMMTVAAEGDPAEFPPYRYNDLAATFGPLIAEARRLVNIEFDPVFIEVPLRPYQNRSWLGELRDDRLLHCSTFVLVVEVDGDRVVASNEIPEVAKVASWQRIQAIVKLNALGVPMRPAFHPPAEIPIKPKQVYFLLDVSDPLWQEVMSTRKVAVFIRDPYGPQYAQARLLAIPREDG